MLVWILTTVTIVVLLRLVLRYNIAKCTSEAKMNGKVVIVTGANAGIGFHTAKELAAKGARVILACRNEERAIRARDQIVQETRNEAVEFKQLDLASLTSVRKFCEDFKASEEKLDVLVNNAGVYGLGDKFTEDGILEVMQVNLFAPMILTDLLLPLLKQAGSSRVVNVTSLTYCLGELRLPKINKAGCYGDLMKYCNSKLGNVVFTVELARRLRGSGVVVSACHPGVVYTTITRKAWITNLIFAVLCWVCSRTAAEAAATSVHLSACAGGARAAGAFYVDCARWPAWSGRATAARDLWPAAEQLMGCKLQNMTVDHQ